MLEYCKKENQMNRYVKTGDVLIIQQIAKLKKMKNTNIFYILHEGRFCTVCRTVGTVKRFPDKNFPSIYHAECEKCGAKLK